MASSVSADDVMLDRLRKDFAARSEPPVTLSPPQRNADGSWRSPDGAPITLVGILSWNRPKQNDGVPFTAYACASEGRYWVHRGGGLGGTEFWFGPLPLP
jgi:hypothetical protein